MLEHARERTFAFDEFGPLTIQPVGGAAWAPRGRAVRLRASYHKPHGSRQFYARYAIGADRLTAISSPTRDRSDVAGDPSHPGQRREARRSTSSWTTSTITRTATCATGATATSSSWCSPRRTHRGPTRSRRTSDRCASSSSPTAATPTIECSAGRSAGTCAGETPTPHDPQVLAAERPHRAKIRGEAQRRWGHPRTTAAGRANVRGQSTSWASCAPPGFRTQNLRMKSPARTVQIVRYSPLSRAFAVAPVRVVASVQYLARS